MQASIVYRYIDALNYTLKSSVSEKSISLHSRSFSNSLQTVLNSYSGMDIKPDSKPNKEMCEKYRKEIDTILSCLLFCTTNRTFTGQGRDAVIELIMRNIHHDTLNWAEQLVEQRGLHRLMEVASELEEYKYESAMDITENTRTVTSVCLARIYENMYYDAARAKFYNAIDEFIKDKLISPDIESKVLIWIYKCDTL